MNPIEIYTTTIHGPWTTAGQDIQFKVANGMLCFQQTASMHDWELNFSFPAVPYKRMEDKFLVHGGFLKGWKSVRDEIAKLEFSSIAGFSLGGAYAVLAHEDFLFRKGYEPDTMVFGCPKVLFMPSKNIRNRFSRVLAYRNEGDLVAKLPLFYTNPAVHQIELITPVVRPDDIPIWRWLSNHEPSMYRQRLTGLE